MSGFLIGPSGVAPAAVPPSGTTILNNSDRTFANVTLDATFLIATGSNGYGGVRSVASYSTGKKFFSVVPTVGAAAFDHIFGIANSTHALTAGPDIDCAVWALGDTHLSGNTGGVNIGTTNGVAYTVGHVVDFAVDLDNNKIWVRTQNTGWNGDILANQDPANNIGGHSIAYMSKPWFVYNNGNGAVSTVDTFNFGATAYTYSPPTGGSTFSDW